MIWDFIAEVVDTTPIIAFSTIVFIFIELSVLVVIIKRNAKFKETNDCEFSTTPKNIKKFMASIA